MQPTGISKKTSDCLAKPASEGRPDKTSADGLAASSNAKFMFGVHFADVACRNNVTAGKRKPCTQRSKMSSVHGAWRRKTRRQPCAGMGDSLLVKTAEVRVLAIKCEPSDDQRRVLKKQIKEGWTEFAMKPPMMSAICSFRPKSPLIDIERGRTCMAITRERGCVRRDGAAHERKLTTDCINRRHPRRNVLCVRRSAHTPSKHHTAAKLSTCEPRKCFFSSSSAPVFVVAKKKKLPLSL